MLSVASVKQGDHVYYLKPEVDYTVGRKACDVLIMGDASISKKHAKFHVRSPSAGSEKPELQVTDLGSKFGTFLLQEGEKERKLIHHETATVGEDVRVKFGLLENVWIIRFNVITATTSTLNDGKEELIEWVEKLGGEVLPEWSKDCSHLVMNTISLTVKAVCALASGKPIVTPKFFEDLVNAVESKKVIPDHKKYLPESSEPDFKDNKPFAEDPTRSTLFRGKCFVFPSAKEYDKLATAVSLCDGVALMFDSCGMSRAELAAPNVLVFDYCHRTASQPSQVPPAGFKAIEIYLKSKGRRLIADLEVGLAVLLNSTEKFCNAEAEVALSQLSNIVKQKPNVLDTQNLNSISILDGTTTPASRNSSRMSQSFGSQLKNRRESVKRNHSSDSEQPLFKRPTLTSVTTQDTDTIAVPLDEDEDDDVFSVSSRKSAARKGKTSKNNDIFPDSMDMLSLPSASGVKHNRPGTSGKKKALDLFAFSSERKRVESTPSTSKSQITFHDISPASNSRKRQRDDVVSSNNFGSKRSNVLEEMANSSKTLFTNGSVHVKQEVFDSPEVKESNKSSNLTLEPFVSKDDLELLRVKIEKEEEQDETEVLNVTVEYENLYRQVEALDVSESQSSSSSGTKNNKKFKKSYRRNNIPVIIGGDDFYVSNDKIDFDEYFTTCDEDERQMENRRLVESGVKVQKKPKAKKDMWSFG